MTTCHVRGLFQGWEASAVMEIEESSSTDTVWLWDVGPGFRPGAPQLIINRGRMSSIGMIDFLITFLALETDNALFRMNSGWQNKTDRVVHPPLTLVNLDTSP